MVVRTYVHVHWCMVAILYIHTHIKVQDGLCTLVDTCVAVMYVQLMAQCCSGAVFLSVCLSVHCRVQWETLVLAAHLVHQERG